MSDFLPIPLLLQTDSPKNAGLYLPDPLVAVVSGMSDGRGVCCAQTRVTTWPDANGNTYNVHPISEFGVIQCYSYRLQIGIHVKKLYSDPGCVTEISSGPAAPFNKVYLQFDFFSNGVRALIWSADGQVFAFKNQQVFTQCHMCDGPWTIVFPNDLTTDCDLVTAPSGPHPYYGGQISLSAP